MQHRRELVDVETEGTGSAPWTATVLPGRGYGCDAPLLRATRSLLRERGWTVRTVRWRDEAPGAEDVTALGRELLPPAGTGRHLVVAKSLTTRLLPLAAERGLPGVWLTPLLGEQEVRAAAARATAPTLLIGGDADPYGDSAVAAASGQRVLELPGADHSLEVPGDAEASRAALDDVVAAVRGFLDDVERAVP
ncbi:alpha/beta hydrolase [Kineococcus arenarius]|uniref:alpha/beta hydrolase n=1 Tax=Kineococcus sp. SYSU DK007 TaxID=3383128 RepID=UPI003D7EEBFA